MSKMLSYKCEYIDHKSPRTPINTMNSQTFEYGSSTLKSTLSAGIKSSSYSLTPLSSRDSNSAKTESTRYYTLGPQNSNWSDETFAKKSPNVNNQVTGRQHTLEKICFQAPRVEQKEETTFKRTSPLTPITQKNTQTCQCGGSTKSTLSIDTKFASKSTLSAGTKSASKSTLSMGTKSASKSTLSTTTTFGSKSTLSTSIEASSKSIFSTNTSTVLKSALSTDTKFASTSNSALKFTSTKSAGSSTLPTIKTSSSKSTSSMGTKSVSKSNLSTGAKSVSKSNLSTDTKSSSKSTLSTVTNSSIYKTCLSSETSSSLGSSSIRALAPHYNCDGTLSKISSSISSTSTRNSQKIACQKVMEEVSYHNGDVIKVSRCEQKEETSLRKFSPYSRTLCPTKMERMRF